MPTFTGFQEFSEIPLPTAPVGWVVFLGILSALFAVWLAMTWWFIRDVTRRHRGNTFAITAWVTGYVVVSIPLLVVWILLRPRERASRK